MFIKLNDRIKAPDSLSDIWQSNICFLCCFVFTTTNVMMTMTVATIAITVISFGTFCRTNKQAWLHHLVYLYSLSVSLLSGIWFACIYDCHVPFIILPTPKHLDSFPNALTFILLHRVLPASKGRWPLFLPWVRPSPTSSIQSRGLVPGGRSTSDFWQNIYSISHPWLGMNLAGPSLLFSDFMLWASS